MKIKLAILGLAGVFFWGGDVRADTITTGDLSFAGSFSQSGIFVSSVPTAGSFAYDNTTNQFLSLMVTWDGITFTAVAGLPIPPAFYAEMIGSVASQVWWAGNCISSHLGTSVLLCDTLFGFTLADPSDIVSLEFLSSSPIAPTFLYDSAGGKSFPVTATNLVTTTTPEPSLLVLLGIGLLGLYKSASRRHQPVRQSQ